MTNITNKKQSIRKLPSLSISGVDGKVREEFINLTISNDITQARLLSILLSNYKSFYIPLSTEEEETLRHAQKLAPDTLRKKIKRAALRHASNLINSQDSKDVIDINTKNSPKAADARADSLLEQIFKHNDKATNLYDKIFITKTAILYYTHEQKELNPEKICIGKAVLDRCLERHREAIEAHHNKHTLEVNHNTKAHYERLKTAKHYN